MQTTNNETSAPAQSRRYTFGGQRATERKPRKEPQKPVLPSVMSLASRPASLAENVRDALDDMGRNLCRGSAYAARAVESASAALQDGEIRSLTTPPPEPATVPASIEPAKTPGQIDVSGSAVPGEGLDIQQLGAKPHAAADGFSTETDDKHTLPDLGDELAPMMPGM